MKTAAAHPAAQRGALLIVAMILSAVIGISLASYISLGRTSLAVSNRALYNNAAMNLAENGLEEAVFAINKTIADPSYPWTDWTASGSDIKRKWTGYTFDQNATGIMRVYIFNYTSTAPEAVARSTVTLGGGDTRTVEKWVRVTLRKTSKFANGLVAKQTINFNGSPQIDSWNSDPDNDGSFEPYDDTPVTGNRNDNGSVGSISVGVNAVLVDNADIWGYVGTGGAAPKVGSGGTIGPFGTPDGTTVASHISTDFSASFDAVTAPTTYSYTNVGALSSDLTLPDDFTVPMAADGKYYIECSSMGGSNNLFTIADGKKVVLHVTDTVGYSIDIKGGSGGLNVGTGSSLEIYTAGNINIGGQGAMNGGTTEATMGAPVNLQIYGTKTSGTQTVGLSGNGVLSAVLYVPQGSISLDGSVECYGSIVGNDITLNGTSAKFHYDESLGNFGGNNPYRVSRWQELTQENDPSSTLDRAYYRTYLDF